MDIHDRLKEERKRLGLNQTDFGKIAGVGKTTQINYESGERSPDAAYLAAIAAAGGDVQYIVTGTRSEMALAPDERLMLDRYRASPKALRDAALRVLLGGESSSSQRQRGGIRMTFHGAVGSQTNVDGDCTVVGQEISVAAKHGKK